MLIPLAIHFQEVFFSLMFSSENYTESKVRHVERFTWRWQQRGKEVRWRNRKSNLKKKKEIGRKSKGLDIFSVLNFCQFFFKYASRCFSQHSTKLAIKILMSEMSDQAWTNFHGKISYHILYISSIYLLMYFWFFRSSKHYQKWLFPAK